MGEPWEIHPDAEGDAISVISLANGTAPSCASATVICPVVGKREPNGCETKRKHLGPRGELKLCVLNCS